MWIRTFLEMSSIRTEVGHCNSSGFDVGADGCHLAPEGCHLEDCPSTTADEVNGVECHCSESLHFDFDTVDDKTKTTTLTLTTPKDYCSITFPADSFRHRTPGSNQWCTVDLLFATRAKSFAIPTAAGMATAVHEEEEGGIISSLSSSYGSVSVQELKMKSTAETAEGAHRKWLMLAILSVLSALNQGICFSYAPIASIVEDRWQQHIHSTELITVYFVSYIPCSFLGSWVMDKEGLRYGVLLGGFLQAVGASLRYFACVFDPVGEAYVTLAGQIVASMAMPFMVNSPAVLSANWFPPSMRATSTSVAVNANAMGTAFVYLSAPFVVLSSDDVPMWNLCVAVVAVVSWVVGVLFFRSFPKTAVPPSGVSDLQLGSDYDWGQWASAFTHRGFWHTVVVFSLAECVLNAMCTLIGKFLSVDHFSKAEIGLVGAAFIVSSLVGGQFISHYVDRKRNHKTALQVCLLLTAVALAAFRSSPKSDIHASLASLLFLGAVLGPIQPVVLELGVECAYPTSEATVAALQQLCGNFLSAVVVPGLSALRRTHTDATGHVPPQYFYASPEWVMTFMTASTLVLFCFFNGKYKRFEQESNDILPHCTQ